MKAVVVFFLIVISLTMLPMTVNAEAMVTIFTDADTYEFGDMVEISLSAQNDGEGMSVAVYIALLTPDAWIYTLSPWDQNGWSGNVEAWIPEIYVPSSFDMGATSILSLDLPCSMPPIQDAGAYSFASVLMYPGTSDWVCNASLAPFSYEAGPTTDITMLSIPAGSFLMGSPEGEEDHRYDEGPQRTVNISAFMMSETEVTQGQWEDVICWNDSWFSGDDYPVEYITWFDCLSFCNKLSWADGYTECYAMTNVGYEGEHIISADVSCNFQADGYRLPTEAEWEYACRAGTTNRYYTGDSESDLGRAGWFYDNSGETTHAVGEKKANAWGLCDMHGNVWEWCWDWYSLDYYGMRPDPDSDPAGASSGSDRVVRGGSCFSIAQHCRSALRHKADTWPPYTDSGFRVVRSSN